MLRSYTAAEAIKKFPECQKLSPSCAAASAEKTVGWGGRSWQKKQVYLSVAAYDTTVRFVTLLKSAQEALASSTHWISVLLPCFPSCGIQNTDNPVETHFPRVLHQSEYRASASFLLNLGFAASWLIVTVV